MASKSGSSAVVQFTPVNTGDMSEIPPDLPPGEWTAECSLKKSKTSNGGYPMLIAEWKTLEALTDGNEDHVGAKAADFIVFFPSNHKASRMTKIRFKKMCEALKIDVPAITKLNSWDDIADFIEELDGLKATVYTTVEERKDTGELVSKISYVKPGSSLKAAMADDEDEEDEEEEKPKKKPAGSAAAKKKRSN